MKKFYAGKYLKKSVPIIMGCPAQLRLKVGGAMRRCGENCEATQGKRMLEEKEEIENAQAKIIRRRRRRRKERKLGKRRKSGTPFMGYVSKRNEI